MATNNYCENKSKKPVITKYDPSKNYMVQMVDSLSSIDYPNENHIYVIESTGEKFIFYNGAFSKFTSTPLEPLIVEYTATYSSSDRGAYQYYYSNNVIFYSTYDDVAEAINQGRPVYLKNRNGTPEIKDFDIHVTESNIQFTYGIAIRNSNNTQHDIENGVFILPNNSTTGQGTRVRILAHNLVPDSALSSTSTRPVQNKVVKQAIDSINMFPSMVITGDINNYEGTVSVKNGITDDTTYVMYQWGNLKGISPIITVTYTNGSNVTVTEKYMAINGSLWKYSVNTVKMSFNAFSVMIAYANTLYPNRNKTLFIGGKNESPLLYLKITDDNYNQYDIETIKGDISQGTIVPTEGATTFVAIPLDGKNITLRNISSSNISLSADSSVGNWILTGSN